MAECPHESHDITYKFLSTQHKRKVNDVIMSFFLTAPRSHGPSSERIRSHIILSWYLTKKLPSPRPGYPRMQLGALDHNQGLIHQGTQPRITPSIKQGFPGTHPGALEHIQGLIPSNCLVLDQEPEQYTGDPTRAFCHGFNCLVPDQEPRECIGALDLNQGLCHPPGEWLLQLH